MSKPDQHKPNTNERLRELLKTPAMPVHKLPKDEKDKNNP